MNTERKEKLPSKTLSVPSLGDKLTPVPVVCCPECGSKMHRMGKAWSGRKQVQRYRCPKCGRTATENAAKSATDEVKND